MNIAVLSGKGGTGKTFVSVNLAFAVGRSTYIDCDVEEPNGHLFLKPENVTGETIYVEIPEFDADKCTGCRKCVDFCKFNALAFIKNKPFKFEEVCHSCGGCKIICPEGAVFEKKKPIGEIKRGQRNDIVVISGVMNEGEESGVPIIRRLCEMLSDGVNITDCPPGSGCTVMESIENADYCVIVAEPTIFGVHNFLMVYELVKIMKKPFGVIINKDDNTENPMAKLCREQNFPVIMRIGYREEIAKGNAKGDIAAENSNEVKELFNHLYKKILREVEA